jgi:hypothetical protein
VYAPKPGHGFIVQTRGAIELTTSRIKHCQRLDRPYEVTLTAHEELPTLTPIALLLRRLDRSQMFDTL